MASPRKIGLRLSVASDGARYFLLQLSHSEVGLFRCFFYGTITPRTSGVRPHDRPTAPALVHINPITTQWIRLYFIR
jgi:hypothetical protein